MAEVFREQRTLNHAEFLADTRKRPDIIDDRRGNGTVEAVFHRKIETAVPASHN